MAYGLVFSQGACSLSFTNKPCLCIPASPWIRSARSHCCRDIHKHAFVWLTPIARLPQTRALCPFFRAPLSSVYICNKNGAPDCSQTWSKRNLHTLGVLSFGFCTLRFYAAGASASSLDYDIVYEKNKTAPRVHSAKNISDGNKWAHCNKNTFMQEHR